MAINLILPPPAHCTVSSSRKSRSSETTGIKTRNWQELALKRDWQGAILGYLREKRREAIPLWTVLNGICAAAEPRDRRETRELKTEILKALGQLSRTRRVLRWRRTKLAIPDTGDRVVSLEQFMATSRALPAFSRSSSGRK